MKQRKPRRKFKRVKRNQLVILPYEVAKEWHHRMRITGAGHLREYAKIYKVPKGITKYPNHRYKDQYEGAKIFYYHHPAIMDFNRAKLFIRQLGIDTLPKYRKYVAENEPTKWHSRLPRNPNDALAWQHQWKGWADFLGVKRKHTHDIHKEMLPYNEAKQFVHNLGLRDLKSWDTYAASDKRPSFIPSTPVRTYAGQYEGLRAWLGTDVKDSIEVRQQSHASLLFYRYTYDHSNMLSYDKFEGGRAQVHQFCLDNPDVIPVRMYQHDAELVNELIDTITKFSSSHSTHSRTFTTPNWLDIQFEFDMSLPILRFLS